MKNSQKGFTPLMIVVVLAGVIILSGALYLGARNYNQIISRWATPTPTQPASGQMSEQKTSGAQKDCGTNTDCFIVSAQTCTSAKIQFTSPGVFNKDQTQTVLQAIKLSTNGKCELSIRTISIDNPNLTEEMRSKILSYEFKCEYDSADLVSRLKNVSKGITSFSFSTKNTDLQNRKNECDGFGSPTAPKNSLKIPPPIIFTSQELLPLGAGGSQLTSDGELNVQVESVTASSVSVFVYAAKGLPLDGEYHKQIELALGQSAQAFGYKIEVLSINEVMYDIGTKFTKLEAKIRISK